MTEQTENTTTPLNTPLTKEMLLKARQALYGFNPGYVVSKTEEDLRKFLNKAKQENRKGITEEK